MVDINWNPSKRDLKIFALLLIVFFSLVASMLYGKYDSPTAAAIVFAAAVVIGTTAFFVPPLSRAIYVGWMVALFPIGWVVSHVFLGIAFYLVFTAFGLLMRICRYDPMRRRFERDAKSYWLPRDEQTKTEQYFRQY